MRSEDARLASLALQSDLFPAWCTFAIRPKITARYLLAIAPSMRIPQLLLLLALPLLSIAQSSLKVVVILNEPDAGGVVLLALCPSAKAYKADTGCVVMRVPANGNTIECTFGSITPGLYAVKVFHDVNENGKLDTNWIGWPQESYGFSNDAPVNTGPPPFKLAAIEVKQGAQTARIRLR